MKESRVGVFVCHCGLNIAGTVDVQQVVASMRGYPGIVHATDYIYMCSEPGQQLIRKAIRENKLDGIVIASCSPSLHQTTFRKAAASEGVNSYRCEIANIREQCSWPHAGDKDTATEKATSIIRLTVEKLRQDSALAPMAVLLTRKALVIGAGLAGMQAALDIADSGYGVILVEKGPAVGGHALELSRTFPAERRVSDAISPLLERISAHPNIKLYTNAEVVDVSGYVGNFNVNIRRNGSLIEEDTVGAIIVATGFELFPKGRVSEYEADPDVLDGLEFERLLAASDEVSRPSDGKVPREVVFIQCVGSRDPEHGVPYCSRICCMNTAKQAHLFKRAVPEGQAYVFYIDIRSDAKGYEEYIKKVVDEDRVLYLRGRVSKVFRDGEKLMVWGVDTLSAKIIEISADLVVLATALVPTPGVKELARKLNIATDQHGFVSEAHLKLRPVETLTAGIYLAGTAQWPRSMPDTIASASAAAGKVISLFSREELLQEPVMAAVDDEICSGCGQCLAVCPFRAIELNPVRRLAKVNEALCNGCGACTVACPSKAIQHKNWTARQLFEMLDAATAEYV